MTDKKQEVTIAGDLRVDCPKRARGVLSSISECKDGCEHFAGVLDRFPDGKHLPTPQRFMVACRFPFGRAIYEIEP